MLVALFCFSYCQECKCPASGQGTEDGKPTAGTCRWFSLMDEILGKSPSVSPPVVVGSLPTSQVRVRVEEDDEEEEVRGAGADTGSAAAGEQLGGAAAAGAVVVGGAQGRREREDPFLVLVREDIQYQRQADERREAAAKERSERFFSLLERLVERRE